MGMLRTGIDFEFVVHVPAQAGFRQHAANRLVDDQLRPALEALGGSLRLEPLVLSPSWAMVQPLAYIGTPEKARSTAVQLVSAIETR